jgi:hypothetical protein
MFNYYVKLGFLMEQKLISFDNLNTKFYPNEFCNFSGETCERTYRQYCSLYCAFGLVAERRDPYGQ